jgi:outer membrane protein assembly factor BamB
MQAVFALAPAAVQAQTQTTRVVLSLEHFLYDLNADCGPFGFSYPEQYIEWSMVQDLRVFSGRSGILRAAPGAVIDDPRRPRQSCPPYAIGAGGDRWVPVDNLWLDGTFDSNGGPIVVTIEMFDDDGDNDQRLDLTQQNGSTVRFEIDPETHNWSSTAQEPFCNTPVAGCTDNEGQWCGGCNDAQACCNSGNFNFHRGYAFRGDGNGAGISWRVDLTRLECTARRDIDSDRDGLLDDWEIYGKDTDCDGTFDMPFNSWGANPMHKDIFIEYDACFGQRISKQGVANLKAAFAAAPVDAGGWPNPDGLPGINVHVDTGNLIDPTAHEGVDTCHDGIDNDGAMGTDAADPDCLLGTQEAAGPCDDRIDNDGTGTADIGGTCSGFDANNAEIVRVEGVRGNCADGVSNNDGDSLTDANDPQCRVGDDLGGGGSTVMCPGWGIPHITDDFLAVKATNFDPRRHGLFRYAVRWPKSGRQSKENGVINGCSNGIDDERNGLTDGNDPVCQLAREDGLTGIFPGGDCQTPGDDDGDGLANGQDPECRLVPELPSTNPGSCWDTLDNGDDLIDGADPECKAWGGYSDGKDNMAIFEDDDAATVLMHELGHTLDLHHAGATPEPNYKPNYLSVMNYVYATGIPQDPDAMMENASRVVESVGGPFGSCTDRIDNDGDGLIDALDWQCRASCRDTIDNDSDGMTGDGTIDALDPDCRGIDLENDGIAEFLKLDFSPPTTRSGRAPLMAGMHELIVRETDPFVDIDTNGDQMQDTWADALNMIRFRRWLPNNVEGTGTCRDGADHDNNGAMDYFDSFNCRLPQPIPRTIPGSPILTSYLQLPRTGERMVSNHPPALTWLPGGFDWNADGDINDSLTLDMHEDEDTSNDEDEPLAVLEDFDDWRNIKILIRERHLGGPAVSAVLDHEPSVADAVDFVKRTQPADLVLDSATARLVPNATGGATLTVDVENIEPSVAFGPVTLVVSGLPASTTVTATGGRCWSQNGETICARERMNGYEVWTLSFTLQNDLCSWASGSLNLRAQHAGGYELNPEDNTLEIEVGGSGVWSQWRQCASHWGASNYTGPSTLGTPTTVWSGSAILNTPVIDEVGDIYLADAGRNVRKIGPNGASRWTQAFSSVVRAGPALTPVGTLVVATEDGRLRGLSRVTGMELWSYPIPASVLSALVVAGDRVYAVTQFGFGLADSVFAFDINGTFLWSRQLSGPLVSAPTVGTDGTIYASVASGLFYSPAALTAVSPSGVVLWSKQLDGDARDTPVQRNGRVYVGTSTRRVYAFNAVTGAQAWMYTTPCLAFEACEISGPPVALPNSQLAVGAGGGRVHVIRDNGTSATLVRSIAASGLFLGGPRDSMVVGANNLAYVGNRNAQMRLLNLTTGTQVSLVAMQGNSVGSVALDGLGRFYVGTDAGRLYRY